MCHKPKKPDLTKNYKLVINSRLVRCGGTARGSSSGLSLGGPTKVKLVSLFYSLKVPLKLKIKNTCNMNE